MPKIVAFANQKGGSGKTTGAIHALDWFQERAESAVLVDADGQGSSSSWCKTAGLPYKVIGDPEDLMEELPKLAEEYGIVIVDGPGNASETTKAILARADLVFIPSRDSVLDLESTSRIVRFVRHMRELRGGSPVAAIYLNAVKEKTLLAKEAQELLAKGALPLLRTAVPDRQCIKDAPGQGSTVFRMKGRGVKEVADIYGAMFGEALELYMRDAA